MIDLIVKKRIRAPATGSKGMKDSGGDTDLPLYAETNNAMPEDDPFFRVSPAVAIDDCYFAELSAPAPTRKS